MQTEKEQIQNQIQELQEKLQKLEEVENEKMEFKDEGRFHFFHYNGKPYQRLEYTVIPNVSWFESLSTLEYPIPVYEKVMNSELNKKLEELYQKQIVPEEPEDNEWKSVALRFGEELVSVGPCGYYDFTAGEWLEWTLNECKKEEQEVEPSMTNCVITGNPPNGYVTWQEWYNELGSKGILHNLRISSIEYEVREWDVVREIMNWCKEHPGQNPLDWVKPKTPEQVNPFVPKELEELVKEGVKQKDDYPYK